MREELVGLTTEEIKDATQNIARIRGLEKSGKATHIGPGSITFGPPTPIPGCIAPRDGKHLYGDMVNTFQ